MRKRIIIFTLIFTGTFLSLGNNTAYAKQPITAYAAAIGGDIAEPCAPKIDWRYTLIDGKLYKRLYDYTNQCWIGGWIWCP